MVEMNENGFASFVLIGTILVALVLGIVGTHISIGHWRNMQFLESGAVSDALGRVEEVKRHLGSILRWAAAEALVEVGRRASDFSEGRRLQAVRELLFRNFFRGIQTLEEAVADAGLELYVPREGSSVEISEVENGCVKVRLAFPEGAGLSYSSPDGSLRIKVPLAVVESFLDARFFLL
ncbi:MAG: hypothetical protein ACK4GQ_00075, partial [Candidatus Hadarchaeales archaeon]